MITVGPGKQVAILANGRGTVQYAHVKSVGKRDIVLDDGQRFSVATQQRRTGGTWGTSWRLAEPDDPTVLEIRRRNRIRNTARKLAEVAQAVAAGRAVNEVEAAAEIAALAATVEAAVNGQRVES